MTWTPTGPTAEDRRPSDAGEVRPGPVTVRGHVTATGPPSAASPPPALDGSGRLSPLSQRREVPYLVLGVALVVAGALGAILLTSRAGQQVQALVLVRDVPIGQPLTAGDLRAEPVLAGSTVPLVLVDDAASMVGRVAAVPLRAGHLLAPDDAGGPSWPPPDRLLLAVAVSPGSYPPELAPGMHVLVVTGPNDAGEPAAATGGAGTTTAGPRDLSDAVEAVVAASRPNPNGTGGSVVSLLLSRVGAAAVTAVPASRLHLIVVPVAAPSDAASAPSSPRGGE